MSLMSKNMLLISSSQRSLIMQQGGGSASIRPTTIDSSGNNTELNWSQEVQVDANAGVINLNLPDKASNGQVIKVKKMDSSGNAITISAPAGKLIDGKASFQLLDQYDAVIISYDKTNYVVFSSHRYDIPSKIVNVNTATANIDWNQEVLADSASTAITLSLPDTASAGRVIRVKKTDSSANIITISSPAGKLIDGKANFQLLDQNDGVIIYYDGTNYQIFAGFEEIIDGGSL